MKLAVVSPYPPGWRGIGEYGRHVVEGLATLEGFEDIVVLADRAPGAPAEERRGAVRVRRVWEQGNAATVAALPLRLVQERPDVVWFNLGLGVFGGGLAAALGLSGPAQARALGLPSVATLHEVLEAVDLDAIQAPLGPLQRKAARLAVRLALHADAVCVTLDRYRTMLAEHYGRADAVLAPHGGLGARSTQPPPLSGPPHIVMLACHAPHKGLELLLNAFAALRQEGRSAELVIIGMDHPRFAGYLAGVQARWSGLPGVRWTGYLDEDTLAHELDAATVIAAPSLATTGASSVLARAAAHGRAVASADLPDLRDMAAEAHMAAEFFPAGSVDGLASALRRLLDDTELRRRSEEQNAAAGRRQDRAAMCSTYARLLRTHARHPAVATARSNRAAP
ncbi:MAG: glycosyltransferase family 4 protein [Chloroflexi bacterium]|nr:glycosyltransferase family 4 protein [Chloroflexota bacterium]